MTGLIGRRIDRCRGIASNGLSLSPKKYQLADQAVQISTLTDQPAPGPQELDLCGARARRVNHRALENTKICRERGMRGRRWRRNRRNR